MRSDSRFVSATQRLLHLISRAAGPPRWAWRIVLMAAVLIATLVPAVLVPAAPALADGAVVTSAGPTVTVSPVEGSKYTGELGTITADPCEGPVIEVVHSARRVARVAGSAAPREDVLAAAAAGGVTPADSSSECGALAPEGTINWGDGTTSAAAFTPAQTELTNGGVAKKPDGIVVGSDCTSDSSTECTWTVTDGGSHVYAHAGDYTVTWYYQIYEDGEYQPQQEGWTGTVKVGLAAQTITISDVTVTRNASNQATLTASLNYPDTSDTGCDFTATIDWGDGDTNQPAVVQNYGNEVVVDCSNPVNDVNPDADANPVSGIKPAVSPTGTPGPPWEIVGSHTYSSASEPTNSTATVTVTYNYPASGSGDSDTPPTGSGQGTIPYAGSASTGEATLVGDTSATLTGNVDPRGGTVSACYFEYGPTTAYGSTIPCSPAASDITGATPVTAAVTGLSPSTQYHYELVFTTEVGTVQDTVGDQTLTTLAPPPPGAPAVETGTATAIGQSTATLNGVVNPVGGTLSDCHFEYGPGTAAANLIYSAPCSQTSISGTGSVDVSAAVSDLTAGQQWSFELVAANPNVSASVGAIESFTTLPDCGVTVTFNWAKVTGCLLDQNGVYTATPGTTVDVNGLLLNTGNDDDVVINPAKDTIQSDDVAVGADLPKGQTQNGFGNILLYLGPINWTVPAPSTSTNGSSVPIATLVLPQQQDGSTDDVDGMKMDGDLAVSFDSSDDADMSGNAWLNLPDWLTRAVGVTGAISFKTAPGKGLSSSSEKITEANWSLFGSIGVKNFNLTYDPVHDMWTGGAQLVLPTPNQLTVNGTLSLEHGDFHSFSVSVNNANIPIGDAVFLQEFGLTVGIDPLTLGGSAGFSFGPQVDNKSLVNLSGAFTYQAAYNNAPQLLQVTGQLSILWLKGANAYFDYYDPGGFRFGASFAPSISGVPILFKVSLDGAISGSHFDLDGQASATLKYVDLSAGAEVLVSDTGAVGCLHLSVLGFGWSPGAAYTWATHSWDLMGKGCSVAGWETLSLGQGSSSAAGGAKHIALPAGSDLLEVDGAKGAPGPPKVTLSGPDGQRITTPAHSVKPLYERGLQVLQDPHDNRTWIAVQHGGGEWTVTPEPGSEAIVKLRAAKLLPTPQASGQISGKGGKRTLTWKVTPIAGERVTFWELGKGVARVIGSSGASHGVLRFTPGLGAAGTRTIQADITIDGRPRTDIALAHFHAAAPPKPAKPAKVTVKAAGKGLKVSWAPARNVALELVRVTVTKGDGATLTAQVGSSHHSVTVTDINPIKAATVRITPQSQTGEPGPTTVVHYPKGKAKKK